MNYSQFFEKWEPLIPKKELEKALNNINSLSFKYNILPNKKYIFKAFFDCPIDKLNIVFLGQDPYSQKDIATGLCFANNSESLYTSPSLKVLLDSIDKYYDDVPIGGKKDLHYLAKQGVLLLNSALTVIENNPASNLEIWDLFTKQLIINIKSEYPHTIFVLFGEWCKRYSTIIDKEFTILSPHPSYCARNNILLPNIFKQIDGINIKYNKPLIYWK